MYTVILGIHNFWRWIVLLLAAFALLRAYTGWLGKRPWTETDRKAGTFYGIAMDIQLLLGLLLYFILSPITKAALADLGAVMVNQNLAFFTVEHSLTMFIAVVFVHMGSAFSRRATMDATRHRTAGIWFSIATLAVVLAIPWWRPLLRI